jgi:hypothetical protein
MAMKKVVLFACVGFIGTALAHAAVDSATCKNLKEANCVAHGDDTALGVKKENTMSMLKAGDLSSNVGIGTQTRNAKKAKKFAQADKALSESNQFQKKADEITRQSLIYNTTEYEKIRRMTDPKPGVQ